MAPDVFGGRYRLSGVLGRGGMATVYDGWDLKLGRPVAVKVLHPSLTANPEFRERMAFEARSAAALHHPNIVVVHDSGEDARHGGAPYLIMERLPGRSLLDAIARGPLSPPQVRRVLSEILAGLTAAHAAGVVHRDVKPANVLFGAAGEAKIADFGVAKTGAADLTQLGQVVGTMAYLSPERIAGHAATPMDDLYAVGAVGYEALTGRMPFPQTEPAALLRAIAQHDLPPLLSVRPDVDPVLASVIERSMAHDPADRFPHAQAMLAALNSVRPATRVLASPLAGAGPPMTGAMAPPPPPGRRRKVLAACAIAAAALLALMVVVLESTSSSSDPAAPVPTSTTAYPTAPESSAETTFAPAPTSVETAPARQGNGHGRNGPKKPKDDGDG